MDIAKPATVASIAASSATPGPFGRTGPGQTIEQDFGSAKETIAVFDRVDIGPLSLPGALQILLAEVREALAAELPVLPLPPYGLNPPQNPDQAAHRLVELYLQAVTPEEQTERAAGEWLAQLARVDAAADKGFERALQVVTEWREVTPPVIASLQEARGMMVSALTMDELPGVLDLAGSRDQFNPAWLLRPDWLTLAPRLERFRRRRRKFRKSAPEPDASDPMLPFA